MKQTIAAWLVLVGAVAFAACGDDGTDGASGTGDDGAECGGCAIPRCDARGPCDCGCVEGATLCVDGMNHVCTSESCFASEDVPCADGSTTSGAGE